MTQRYATSTGQHTLSAQDTGSVRRTRAPTHRANGRTAVSTGVRKELGELLGWFHESERLARSAVEAVGDAGQVGG